MWLFDLWSWTTTVLAPPPATTPSLPELASLVPPRALASLVPARALASFVE